MISGRIRPGLALLLFFALPTAASGSESRALTQEPGAEKMRFEVLFMGNSHSSSNNLPGLVATLITTGIPGSQASTQLAPGYRYLADRINDGESHGLLLSRPWTHVILQAQKYSTSGRYFYPTDGAEEWIRRITAQNAQPVMFPEWPRLGNTEEGLRVHNLHLYIASNEPACVAPIGLAWEASLQSNPQLKLHAPDGNHSNPAGALLTAYVLYEVITGLQASKLPYIPNIALNSDNQQNLRQVASAVINDNRDECTPSMEPSGSGAGTEAPIDERIPSLTVAGKAGLVLLMVLVGFTALIAKPR